MQLKARCNNVVSLQNETCFLQKMLISQGKRVESNNRIAEPVRRVLRQAKLHQHVFILCMEGDKDARWIVVGGVMGSDRDGRQWEKKAVASYPSQLVELPGRKEGWASALVFEELRSNTETTFRSSHGLLSHRSHQGTAIKKGTWPCLGQATLAQLHSLWWHKDAFPLALAAKA